MIFHHVTRSANRHLSLALETEIVGIHAVSHYTAQKRVANKTLQAAHSIF